MRRFLCVILALCALSVAGCVPTSVLTPAAATRTPGVAPAPATATAVVSAATVGAADTTDAAATLPAATAAPQPTTEAAQPPESATFTSAPLGIAFDYLTSVDGQPIDVLQQGDQVFVYMGQAQPTTGQWVQVFQKPAAQSLVDAIRAQVLPGYAPADCLPAPVDAPEAEQSWPASYTFARIELPKAEGDTPEQLQARARKCPQPYAAIGGLAYFVADANHPEQFAFFSIGQYAIPAAPGRPWQTTLRFLGRAGASAATPPTDDAAAATHYVDDRSDAEALMISFFNAINRREYARAYGYWNAAVGQENGLAPFPQFSQGYADTASVQVTVGAVTTDAGAGQRYYWTPVILAAQTTGGAAQTYVGCYRMHLAQPGFQGAPPFRPLAIESASVQQAAHNADTQALLAAACQGQGQPLPLTPALPPDDITAARYLDDRSDGVQVLRSLFNAINRHEYVRAYSYWETDAAQRPAYNAFEQGYADTAQVELLAGDATTGAAAGNLYHNVPVVLVATRADGKHTYTGCYTLHMANPGMQTEPPFTALGIRSANLQEVANNTPTGPLLSGACGR